MDDSFSGDTRIYCPNTIEIRTPVPEYFSYELSRHGFHYS